MATWLVFLLSIVSLASSLGTPASPRLRQLAAPPEGSTDPSLQAGGRGGAIAAIVGNEDVQQMLMEIIKAVGLGTTGEVVETVELKKPEEVPSAVEMKKVEAVEEKVKQSGGEAAGAAIDKARAMLGLPTESKSAVEEKVQALDAKEPRAEDMITGEEEEQLVSKNLEPSAVDDVSEPKEAGDGGAFVSPESSGPAVSGVIGEGLYKTTEGVGAIDRSTVKNLMESVLRIHVIRTIEDFGKPWTTKGEGRATGSGFPIPNRLIITNAHVASDAHIVRIERPGSPRLWDARVISIAHEPDLCVMTVDGEAFWNGLHPLEFVKNPVPSGAGAAGRQDVPDILDGVYVVGYPTGGDSLSVTQGIVSRVEVGYYAHSSAYLLEIQIDAAINPGNSGGPVVNNRGEVVGVAFQGLTKADSIGYIIPVPIVNHILTDIEDNGGYTGMVSLGVLIQSLRNPVLQDFLGVSEIPPASLPAGVAADGVVVTKVDDRRVAKFQAQFPHWGDLGFRENDVILALDGQNVAEDGSIHFRNVERVAMNFLLCGKYEDDFIDATVLRKKIVINIQVPLDVPEYLVPMHTNNVKPRYLMYGGAIFVPLTKQYILDFKKARNRVGLSTKLNRYQSTFRTDEQKEVVVLSRILSSRSTKGYNIQNKIVSKVNCKKFRDLEHLAELLGVVQPKVQMVEGAAAVGEGSGAAAVGDGDMVKAVEAAVDRDFVRIGFNDDNFNFVLDRNLAKKTDEHLMTFHRIAHPYYL
eukprot:GHVS01035777.1.p1 GENE.GHVS01035777.1~~GHVS01035777.1.p1  ORF type:complete len:749 (+),score=131.01 GHVS01035777.1:255-2501(+)